MNLIKRIAVSIAVAAAMMGAAGTASATTGEPLGTATSPSVSDPIEINIHTEGPFPLWEQCEGVRQIFELFHSTDPCFWASWRAGWMFHWV